MEGGNCYRTECVSVGNVQIVISRKSTVLENSPLHYYLKLWADYMRGGDSRQGYPKKSSVFSTGGVNCWDDLADGGDTHAINVMDGLVDSLTNYQRNALMVSLGLAAKVFSWQRISYEEALSQAHESIEKGLLYWGLN